MRAVLYGRARFRVSGDRGLLVEYGDGVDLDINRTVHKIAAILRKELPVGVKMIIPAYRSLFVEYDPFETSIEELKRRLRHLEDKLDQTKVPLPTTVEIPVCYGGDFGPDIAFVGAHHGLTEDEVVRLHTETTYHIYAIGFAPGFCYLGGLDERLHTPRLETPRTRVPAGSVGIAETQTGVYPLESPGGWRIIGRTPLRLFDPEKTNPFLYKAGDKIRFVAVDKDEYRTMHQREQE